MADHVYTLATFQVSEGKEEEFVAATRGLQDTSLAMDEPPERGVVLRRMDQPRAFISFGVWRSIDHAVAWRSSKGFEEAFGRLAALCDDVVAGPCEVVFET